MEITWKWERRFMELAQHVAQWSKDPSTRVGAVIVDRQRRVVSLGYNGFPRGVKDGPERLSDRPLKYQLTVHAEANAILNATGPVAGCRLYCTLCTCNECAKLIIQAGIREVVVAQEPGRQTAVKWLEAWDLSRQMYLEAGVKILELDV